MSYVKYILSLFVVLGLMVAGGQMVAAQTLPGGDPPPSEVLTTEPFSLTDEAGVPLASPPSTTSPAYSSAISVPDLSKDELILD